ncbi:MAG: DUF350 domain-containing protein [Alphaproteobacteria bacterium]|nr:DUF350 domain-containing protein [Alphaproteobacteria bacterium]
MPELQWLASAFPNFLRYLIAGFALVILFLWIYSLVTPWKEITLIRAGNPAAALAFAGALLGFCLPLANTIRQSHSLVDVTLWAGVALVVQIAVHLATRLLLPDLRRQIEYGETAAGTAAGGLALGFGLINAACLTA